MATYFIGIDIGTTAVKLAVVSEDGNVVADSVCEYSINNVSDQWAEADCGIYLGGITKGMQQLAQVMAQEGKSIADVKAIGLSSQSETIFFLDELKRPLRPAIVWLDNRAVEEAERLNSLFGEEVFNVTGQMCVTAAWPAAKVLWVKNHEPDIWAKTRHVFLMEEYILNLLTGNPLTNGAMLSSTAYWNIHTKQYWDEMLEEIGLSKDMLPSVIESGEAVGKLLPSLASLWGLSEDTFVCSGGMDNAVGALGAGCVEPGQFAYSIGSSLAVTVPCTNEQAKAKSNIPVHYYVLPDLYIYHTFTTGGMCLRWFRDGFCEKEIEEAELKGKDAYEMMSNRAAEVPAGCKGMIFLPHLNGSLAPDINPFARGVFYGITLEHTRGWFIRAVMESLGYVIRRNYEVLTDMGIEIREVIAYGGGAKSPVWNQIIADILQMPVRVTDTQHSACRGAALLAGKATGIISDIQKTSRKWFDNEELFEPQRELKELYDREYSRYKKLMELLEEPFRYI